MKTIPKPASRAEWLKLRRPYVGASEAACLINRHPYLNLADYAANKITGAEQAETRAMRRGRAFETAVANMWSEDHGIAIVPATVLYQRGPFLVTPDFEPLGFDADWLLEVKTAFNMYVDQPLDYWKIQTIVQAWASGRSGVHLAVLDKSGDLRSFYVDATTDEAQFLMVTLEDAATQFLTYTREGKIPEGLELTEFAVRALFPRAEQKTVDIDASTLAWISELADAREIKNAAKKREDAAKDALAAVLVDADCARYGNSTVLTWKNAKDGLAFNRDLFEAEHPGVLELMDDPKYKRAVPGARTMRPTKEGMTAAADMPWAKEAEAW